MTNDPSTKAAAATGNERPEHRLTVLMFTDLLNSSGLKVKLGDIAYATKVARPHNELFRTTLARFPGAREINYTGDGFLATFRNVSDAVEAALLFHHGLRVYRWEADPVRTRIGIHLGESVFLAGTDEAGLTIASHAADMCARLMSLGDGGQTLLTRHAFDDARQYVRAHPALPEGGEAPALEWAAHGPYLFKSKDEPLEVFEVGAVGFAPLSPPPDAEKARRAVRPGEEETLGWRPAQGIEIPGRPGWLLTAQLGEGGFGEVWLAAQGKMKQQRVFKFCFDEERLRSFKRELTFFRLIRDALGEREDIARLYDVKLDAPPFFLESEYARKGNLAQWCEAQGGIEAVPLPRRLEIVAAVATAVGAAHSIGILHKDIKPQNVLMQSRPEGEDAPQLTDFGIGVFADSSALEAHEITAAGFTVHTIAGKAGSGSGMTRLYAPPEQLTGKPYTLQGDVYALGVMLYQIVVGDFSRALAPGWERDVEDEMLREDIAECVDGEPARRFASTTELAERLRSLEQRRTTRAVEQRRMANYARRKRQARLAVIGGAIAAVVAVALGASFFHERGLRQRADLAEQLANSRLGHAEQARDAAEKLVSEAIFGLREKLVPVGKIGVLEDLATAAEGYYANLPPDLVSDTTRRHEVWLALNRAIIALVLSEDDVVEASSNKALALARDLAVRMPEDDGLREDQYLALLGLAGLRIAQEQWGDAVSLAGQLGSLAEDWLRVNPKSIGARRARLAGLGMRMMAVRQTEKNPAILLPLLLEAQRGTEELKQMGVESLETRLAEAVGLFARATMMGSLGRSDASLKGFEEAEARIRAAMAANDGHPLLREVMMMSQRHAVMHLRELARDRGDEVLKKEAYRQCSELVKEMTALADFEPARLERWRGLAWLYCDLAPMVRYFEGDIAAQASLEKGLAAAERAAAPRFDRRSLRSARCRLRLDLCGQLEVNRPAGWEERTFKLIMETVDIEMAPGKGASIPPDFGRLEEVLHRGSKVVEAMAAQPAAAPAMVERARGLSALAQRVIDAFPSFPRPRQTAAKKIGEVADILSRHGRPEAAEMKQSCETWQRELGEQFANDPAVVREKGQQNNDRGSGLLSALRSAPREQRDARLAELETFHRETLAYLDQHRDRLTEYDGALFRGASYTAMGTGLLECGRYAAAEEKLREAITWWTAAAAKAKDGNVALARRSAALDSQDRLAQAIYKQGRKDEGLKLQRETAETMTANALERKTAGRLREAANAWRRVSLLLAPEEKLQTRQRAAELSQEAVRLARLNAGANKSELASILGDAMWVQIDLGTAHLGLGHPMEEEAAYGEALRLSAEKAAVARPEELSYLTFQRSVIRRHLADLLIKQKRDAEAREQAEQLGAELAQLEAGGRGKASDLEEVRKTLQSMRSKLPAP